MECSGSFFGSSRRLDGLINASHPVSAGRLEGFNNRTRDAKRIAYYGKIMNTGMNTIYPY